jgi:hypothetical protein
MRATVRKAIVPAILLFASSSPVLAADNGIYLGASVGQANLEVDDLAGLSAADFDGEDTAFKLIAGIRPLDWLAVEAAYVDFGEPDDDVLGERFEAEADGVSAFGVGFLAVGPVDLFGKPDSSRGIRTSGAALKTTALTSLTASARNSESGASAFGPNTKCSI